MTGPAVVRTAGDLAAATGGELHGDAAVAVHGLTHDSRQVGSGMVFACVPGSVTDGHAHAPDAVASGAAALLCERPLGLGAPEIQVRSVRSVLGRAAAACYGDPGSRLTTVGVTGTNGKTTTVYLLRHIFEAAGMVAESIGTLTGLRTTPEAPELHARLAELEAAGTQAVALEVSSHALVYGRTDGLVVDVAVFTMLGRDHLEFHGDLETYFEAKASLFRPERARRGVVRVDDPWGARLAREATIPITPFALADVDRLELDLSGTRFVWREVPVTTSLVGAVNVANVVAALTAAAELGIAHDIAAAGVAAAGAVPGRLEPVDAGQPFTVLVDYAHTPDALAVVLGGLRPMVDGRLIVVFGAGGDRDTGKRPDMGAAVGEWADLAVVTSDNPRHEDPAAIAAAVASGLPAGFDHVVRLDRREAMAHALAAAQPGDCVVVAGKGHETTQQVGDDLRPFDDRRVAADLLAELGERA